MPSKEEDGEPVEKRPAKGARESRTFRPNLQDLPSPLTTGLYNASQHRRKKSHEGSLDQVYDCLRGGRGSDDRD
jgi:hypothetical protein